MARAILRKAFLLLAAGVVTLVGSMVAAAQIPRCAPRDEMVSILKGTFTETQRAFGFLSPALLVEVFASEGGGFTIVVTGTDGVSCVLVSGVGWEAVPAQVGEDA